MVNSNLTIQAYPKAEPLFSLSDLEIGNVLSKSSQFKTVSQNHYQAFWQLWESEQKYFYKLCLRWMGGNSHDAEDVLNQVMLKAWNKWEKSANKIISPKAWLARIIYNFCMDIHRQRQREARGIENIDDLKFADDRALVSEVGIPESNLLNREMQTYLGHLIESLPDKLRHPFILHCYYEKSYQDIAKQLALSEENTRKRIQKARSILKKQLKKYLAGEDNTALHTFSPSSKDIPKGETFQSDETVISHWESSIPTKSKQEEINYQVTVLCLETLSHLWYSSVNSLGWR
ncbi:RNA polymerase sigma factor [Gloeothece verrucosa]|uniref:RNA polymerase, sigma-24 subunit, ECF subfamily n=1 Tax=Gloeothece verrucosa (strain PCC 7822) TaxID=497965 RepID=E0U9H0_GLOV7|nr:sigma-70 family RNA polymerase sigma factor [Gloeothece verrucosa]ADN12662.1 RNA polymerase, sigma-24 subunit, ECF subfamily [Gloeothece verrucosa PCC 7822]